MNLLDIIIIVTMIFFIVKGVLRGFVREIASLAGVILGILLSNRFQPEMTDYLKPYLPATKFLPLISFAALFVLILVFFNILGWVIKLLLKKALLGWIDRTLGAGLAITKGVIITYLVIVLLTFFLPAKTPLMVESKLAPLIIVSYQSMISLISPDHYQNLKKRFLGKSKEVGRIMSEKIKDITKKDE